MNLNNAYSDATYLKDYLSYRIMAEAGVNAPLVSFVSLSINGEIYGLYVAVEEVGDAFLARNYGEEAGELYKPEASQLENMGGGGNMPRPGSESASADGGATPPENPPDADALPAPQEGSDSAQESWPSRPEGSGPPIPEDGAFPGVGEGSFPGPGQGGPGGGFGESTEGASLVYTDDETDSYSDIFDNAETDADDADFERVIAALKQLSTGEDLDAGVDVEAVLRYFVAHNFVINFDSYTGNMLHNYYLYEEGGRLTMLPWDYNLAFGGFNNNTATENVNWPIDSPLSSGVSEQDRPMWSKLAANDSYLDMYHTYFDELIVNYFESGRFEEELDAVSALIRPHVETDPTAFYTLDEFDAAVESLRRFNLLRAESVRGQLDGSIPSTAAGQEQDASALVDASEVNIPAMGSMGGMRGQGGPQRQRPSESTGENADASPPSDQGPSPSPTSD